MARAVEEAEVIFIGGGNTFRLLKSLYDYDLIEPIRRAIAADATYIGSSAGSIVACPTLKTTKDMPIVQPRSFDALELVPFQISPHYLDPDPSSTHMGETQEERILQFLEENDAPVVGLREGSMLRVENSAIRLTGPRGAASFARMKILLRLRRGADLQDLLLQPSLRGRWHENWRHHLSRPAGCARPPVNRGLHTRRRRSIPLVRRRKGASARSSRDARRRRRFPHQGRACST